MGTVTTAISIDSRIFNQVVTIDKSDLKERIGRLSQTRINQILKGLYIVTEPREI